jgi:hypothetical protein
LRLSLALAAVALVACKGAQPKASTESAASGSEASAAGADPAIYYPLAVGNSWTYQVTDPSGVHEDTIRIVGRDGPWFIDDHRGRIRVDPEGVRDGDRYLLHAPLRASARWSAVDNLVVQRFEITAMDAKVDTKAGGFSGCVIVRNEQPLPKNQGKLVTEWTYAPKVGLVELLTRTEGPSGNQDQVRLQLVAHHLQ